MVDPYFHPFSIPQELRHISVPEVLIMRRFVFTLIGLLMFVTPLLSEDIRVIPQPREMTPNNKEFVLQKSTRIELSEPNNAEDRFAAEQLVAEIQQAVGFKPAIGALKGRAKNVIALVRSNSSNRSFRQLLDQRHLALDEKFDPEGYALDVDGEGVVASANTPSGIFYAVQTLKQMVVPDSSQKAHIQGAHIRDWPAMRYRGVHDDISRGPVPTLDFMKRQIRTAAEFKLNMWSIYLEYTFEYSSDPLIGPPGGSLTPAEIKELVAYAKQYHVDIVPEQQAFGHLHHVLKWEKYSDIAELPHGNVLTPTNPKTYEFIKRLYSELVPLFPSPFFHIGSDETFELGQGKTKDLAAKEGLGKVYFDHIIKVRELMAPYHKRLMFWGDIALRYPDLLQTLPKDLIVMTWNYSPRDEFDPLIKPFRDAGLDVMVCPGVNNWNRIFPDNNEAVKNIQNFVQDGQKLGAIGMLNTTWDDDGEALFNMTWYGILYGAAAAWQPGSAPVDQFRNNFDWAFYRNIDHTFATIISDFDKIHETLSKAGAGDANDYLMWTDYFSADEKMALNRVLPVAASVRDLAENALELVTRNRDRARRNQDTLPVLAFAARRLDFVGMKWLYAAQISQLYWDAYLHLSERARVSHDLQIINSVNGLVEDLRDSTSELRKEYREAWLAENRPYWLDNVLVRYDLELDYWAGMRSKFSEISRHLRETGILPGPDTMGFFVK